MDIGLTSYLAPFPSYGWLLCQIFDSDRGIAFSLHFKPSLGVRHGDFLYVIIELFFARGFRFVTIFNFTRSTDRQKGDNITELVICALKQTGQRDHGDKCTHCITVFTVVAFKPGSTLALVRQFLILWPFGSTLSTIQAPMCVVGTWVRQLYVKHRHNECTNQQTVFI